jgi:hypothetical protein
VQYVVLQAHSPPDQADRPWQEHFALDPTHPDRWTMRPQINQWKLPTPYPSILGSETTVVKVNGRPMARLGPKGWRALALPIDQPNQPHILEIDYRDSQPMSLGLSILEPNAVGAIPVLGNDSGIRVPGSTALATVPESDSIGRQRIVFWPTTKQPYLILANHDESREAVFGTIRILAGPARLTAGSDSSSAAFGSVPSAKQAPAGQSTRPAGRQRILFLERPIFAQATGAPPALNESERRTWDDWNTIYTGADRLIQYLRANGYTGLAMTVAADGTAIYPSPLLQPTPRWDAGAYYSDGQEPIRKDILRLMFRLFDRAGLTLIPIVEFSGRLPRLESQRTGQLAMPFDLVSIDGRTWGSEPGQVNRPPYQPLHPTVQSALACVVDELAARYAGHESFAGVGLGINANSVLALPDPRWGCDASSVRAFLRQANLGSANFQLAGLNAGRTEWLQAHGVAWNQWRGQVLADFIGALAGVVQRSAASAELFVIPLDAPNSAVPLRALSESMGEAAPPDRLNELGIDASAARRLPSVEVLDGYSAESTISASGSPPSSTADREGAWLVHAASWAHFAQFEQQTPLAATSPMIRLQQLTLSGAWNRRRYAAALAHSDRLIILDGGAMIPLGQEESLVEWSTVLGALPNQPFENVPPIDGEPPVVVRQLRAGPESYFYVVNESPWPLQVVLGVRAEQLNALRSLGGISCVARSSGLNPAIEISLPPFEIAAARFDGAAEITGFQAALPAEASGQMQREILDLKSKLTQAIANVGQPLLENPSMEIGSQGTAAGLVGWTIEAAQAGRIVLDASQPYDGQTSLRMQSDGEPVHVRSNFFAAPRTGRLSIAVWVDAEAITGDIPLRLVLESPGAETPFSRTAEPAWVSEGEAGPWRQVAAHFDGLPTDARDLRVGFDLVGPATLRVDRVEIFDRWLDKGEIQSLKQLLNLASYKLQEQADAAGCLRILESYWPRFVDEQFAVTSDSVGETARVPENPPNGGGSLK